MAITGVFKADFAEFFDAVTKAERHLTDMSAGADRAGDRMNKMTDSFSGRKVIQEATLMAEVFDRAGGRAAFTEKELARMGATGSEALAKMKAQGIDIPPGIQRIADEARGAAEAHSGLTSTVKQLAIGFAAMFTARAAFNFIKDTINEASALKDLSQQTHINVEELQSLAGAMSEFGVDADTLGKGLFTLSRKIAGGDDSVVHGLHQMGLSLKDVEGLNGQALFLKIMDGLSTLQGGLRDDTSSQIFGSRLGMAMAGASDGIEGTLETWKRLNHVASTESIDAMDQYGESIDRMQRSLSAMAANMIGPVAEGFNTLVTAAEKGAGKFAIFWAMTKDFAASNSVTGASTEHLARLLDNLNKKTEEGSKKTREFTEVTINHTGAVDARSQATKFLAALEADADKALTSAQLGHLARLKELNALTAKNAEGVGVSAAQYAQYTAGLKSAETAESALIKASHDRSNAAEKIAVATKKASDATDKAAVSSDVWRSSMVFTSEVIGKKLIPELEKAEEKFRQLNGEMMTSAELMKARSLGSTATYDMATAEGRAEVPGNIATWLRDGYSLKQAAALAFALQWNFPLNMNDPMWQQKGPRVPGFAAGVENFGGGLAMVGERGPELVNLPRGSDVIPFGRGGGVTVNVNVSGVFDPAAARTLAKVVQTELMRTLKQGRLLPSA